MLELAGLAGLVEERMDASVLLGENIRTAAPDLVLTACRRLGVSPCDAVTFTHSPAGVVAGGTAGLAVVGVAEGSDAELLRDFGAERIVPSLRSLLDSTLAAGDGVDDRR